MKICNQCGVRAAPDRSRCEGCETAYAGHTVRAPEEPLFARVVVQFVCRGCGLPSPVEGLPTDRVTCARCQLVQAWPDTYTPALLDRAHGVADLLADDADGRAPRPGFSIAAFNPLAGLAATTSTTSFEQDEDWPAGLFAQISAGCPVHEGRPLSVRSVGRDLRAGDARYRCAVDAPGLLGAISDEHLQDQPVDAKLLDGARIGCGSCGAALQVDGSERLVHCTYCGSTTHLPASVRHAMQHDPVPEPWWLAFEGSAPMRQRLAEAEPRAVEPAAEGPLEGAPRAFDLALRWVLPGLALAVAGVLFELFRTTW